jgi:hypothetical protein
LRILLVHPDDRIDTLPWGSSRWDLIVDLGWAGRCAYEQLSKKFGCTVRSVYDLADPRAHAARLKNLVTIGLNCAVDRQGIDWWDLATPYRLPMLDQILMAVELSESIPAHAEVVATRPHALIRMLSELQGELVKTLKAEDKVGVIASIRRYARLSRTFDAATIRQIAFDKWDADFSVRRWLTRRAAWGSAEGRILLPSAYRNVTATQYEFARMLPQRRFLAVVTRQDGRIGNPPPNVRVRNLAAYSPRPFAKATEDEITDLQHSWAKSGIANSNHELKLAGRMGTFDAFPKFLETGLRVRDAWDVVFQKENIGAMISADENNPFTRLPILLANRRKIPTIYAEHGALNFNMQFRTACSDHYLASSEMQKDYWVTRCGLPAEKIEMGLPHGNNLQPESHREKERNLIVFFSSDYESVAGRATEFFREIVGPMALLAKEMDRKLVIKLHPFESLSDRRRMLDAILSPEQRGYVDVLGGPFTIELRDRVWAAITVESSVTVECAAAGIPVFLCAWFDASWWEYGKQFVRFSMAQALNSPKDILEIPQRVEPVRKALLGQDTEASITLDRLNALIG